MATMHAATSRFLSEAELDHASGGFKYDPTYTSKDVVDARGGQVTVLGITVSYDTNGKVTGVSHSA